MKLRPGLLVLFVFLFSNVSRAQKNTYEISIVQDGNVIKPVLANEVSLTKTPFKIQVKLNKLEGVYLYAAFKDSIYKIGNSDSLPGFQDLPAMSMAENSFNPSQELLISDDGWAYWFYNPKEDWHRFDKDVFVEGDHVTGTKTIKQFYEVASGKILPVAEVKEPLYLFFVSAEEDGSHNLTKELQRFKIKINWR